MPTTINQTPTSVTYVATGGETSLSIPFQYLSPTDIVVTDNGTAITPTITGSVAEIGYVASAGHEFTITRQTEVGSARAVFTDPSAILASDLNINVTQALHRLQELETSIESLGTGTGSGNLPTPAGANRFLVGESNGAGGFIWNQKTSAQVATLLGVGTSAVPVPLSGNRFIITNVNSGVYELATVAQIKTILGITALLPTTTGLPNYFMTSNAEGTGYELSSSAAARSKLGLGSAATLNTGTGVGNIPVLVSGSSSAALPAVSGENLTGVNKSIDFAVFERAARITIPQVGAGATSETIGSFVNVTSSPTAPGSFVGTAPAWASLDTSGLDKIKLNPGTYHIKCETPFWKNNIPALIKLIFPSSWKASGSVVVSGTLTTEGSNLVRLGLPVTVHEDLISNGPVNLGKAQVATVDAIVKITNDWAAFAVDAARIGNSAGNTAEFYAGSSYWPSARISIWKLA